MKHIKNEKGHALVLTIILLAVVAILGTVVLSTLVSEIRMNKRIEERTIATYLAQAGVEHGLKILEDTPIGETPTRPSQSFIVDNSRGNIYEYEILQVTDNLVRSTGRIKEKDRIIRRVTINVYIEEGEITTIDVE